MDETNIDWLHTWGREFAQAVASHADEVNGQDGYEVLVRALGPSISLVRLKGLAPEDFDRLTQAAQALLEAPAIQTSDIRKAVEETLWHWGQAG